ncbi:hypothetical protein [Streptomyces violaceusniger]|uniref:Uncharacterized protein n=1 Tax=Streptomyces violaceusniger (strain Tu 4113) TaxID=653045 RepID=G2P135_STRV4|nr:hypothetical protein [Streptomyces violaceusniger]AEM87874.1 hypothetical protein Strvi_8565 [Streptomyces violaceusniger Tu 4113]
MASKQPATTAAGLDPATLTRGQLGGWGCALCGTRLVADRLLGTVTVDHGATRTTYPVWACAPACGSDPAEAPAAWRRYLDHAVGCECCHHSRACPTGDFLHAQARTEGWAAADRAAP